MDYKLRAIEVDLVNAKSIYYGEKKKSALENAGWSLVCEAIGDDNVYRMVYKLKKEVR